MASSPKDLSQRSSASVPSYVPTGMPTQPPGIFLCNFLPISKYFK